jgi:hypothetical protein
MPKGARILDVQEQHGQPVIWAEVDTDAETEERLFEVFGTGHEMRNGMCAEREYVGTFQLHGGSLVFHLYDCRGV